jgi:hypothetical protein
MATTNGKEKARPKTAARADQLRPLNRPQPVTVKLDDAGIPSAVKVNCTPAPLHLCNPEADQQQIEATERSMTQRVVESILEVWHVDDEWWRERISRRYVEVILEGGKHLVLYEDLTTNDWFMQKP